MQTRVQALAPSTTMSITPVLNLGKASSHHRSGRPNAAIVARGLFSNTQAAPLPAFVTKPKPLPSANNVYGTGKPLKLNLPKLSYAGPCCSGTYEAP